MSDRVVKLYDETGNAVGSWLPRSGYAVLGKRGYILDRAVYVEKCERVDGDRCKCSHCETVIDFKEDDFCRGCGAEVYA